MSTSLAPENVKTATKHTKPPDNIFGDSLLYLESKNSDLHSWTTAQNILVSFKKLRNWPKSK